MPGWPKESESFRVIWYGAGLLNLFPYGCAGSNPVPGAINQQMKFLDSHQKKTGVSFGLTSAVVTTLGLMVGVNASTHSTLAVMGGVVSIAFADALSDAMGIHVSEESEGKHSQKEIWEATFFTFLTKLLVGLSFIVPLLLFELSAAVWISAGWGLLLLAIYSYYISKGEKMEPERVIFEHLALAIAVILLTNYIGHYIGEVLL